MAGTVISDSLQTRLAPFAPVFQSTADGVPTFWVRPSDIRDVLSLLRSDSPECFSMLYDICAIDERTRRNPAEQPPCDFSVVYHLLSLENSTDIRVKVPLDGEYPSLPTVSDIWPNANWYEREIWDMFGIRFEGHPFLRRILNPPGWVGHPLRKEHPARATEMEGYELPEDRHQAEEELLKARPEEFGLFEQRDGAEYTILNFGPHHPGTHGLLRIILQLSGETIEDSVVDIGWHHRGAEKMAERQTFHTFIPYTDRIDYLSGVLNNLPYVLSVEKLCGIEVPERAQVIRVMMCELSRIANHLVWFGTFGADVGALSPVFFTFTDRERVFDIVEAVCGGRMHPSWFRIGGVASDLPSGWKELIDDFLEYMPARIDEYEAMVVRNRIFRQRTKGVGVYTKQLAMDWGVTGPNLRSAGINWDVRKRRPYSGYDQFEFDVPLADEGDSYARCVVRIEEMRQSLRIVRQAAENMPGGSYKSEHPLAMPPRKEDTMVAIETLINHFLSVSWGQPVPAGEAEVLTEGAKGAYSYYVVSDGGNSPYRCHIRTPSFAHMQSLPIICRGLLVSDLITILGSIDYVLADVDR